MLDECLVIAAPAHRGRPISSRSTPIDGRGCSPIARYYTLCGRRHVWFGPNTRFSSMPWSCYRIISTRCGHYRPTMRTIPLDGACSSAMYHSAYGIGSRNRNPRRGTDGLSWGFGNAGFGSIRSATRPITRVMWTTRITTRSSMGWSAARVIGRIRPFIALCVWVFTPPTGPVAVATPPMNLASLRNEPRAHSAPYGYYMVIATPVSIGSMNLARRGLARFMLSLLSGTRPSRPSTR